MTRVSKMSGGSATILNLARGVSTFEQVLHKQVIACDRKIEQLDNVRRATIHASTYARRPPPKWGSTGRHSITIPIAFNRHRYRPVSMSSSAKATERYTLVRAN